ncbi:MAG: hypothetical protein ACK5Y6_06365 [Pseudomonadota bacterium]|jgi:hypothetical protein
MGIGENAITRGFDSGFATSVLEEIVEIEGGYASGPERALLSALLFDGVQSCVNYFLARSESEKARFKEGYNWVMENDTDYAFSFVCVCEALGILPDYLKLGILNASNSLLESVNRSRRTS